MECDLDLQIKDLTKVNLEYIDQIDHLKSKNLTLTEINFTQKETIKQQAADYHKLQELLVEEQNKNQELSDHIAQLNHELEDKLAEIQKKDHIIHQRDELISELECEKEDMQKLIKELENTINGLKDENARLKVYLSAAVQQIEKHKAAFK